MAFKICGYLYKAHNYIFTRLFNFTAFRLKFLFSRDLDKSFNAQALPLKLLNILAIILKAPLSILCIAVYTNKNLQYIIKTILET